MWDCIIEKFDSIVQYSSFSQLNKKFREMIEKKIEKKKEGWGMKESFCPFKEQLTLQKILEETKQKENKKNFKLIYLASKDGFGAAEFHEKCDEKEKVVVLIKANNFIFGGYNPECWRSRSHFYIGNSESFIFSLSNPENRPLKFVNIKPSESIYDEVSFGPSFGGGNDICISNNSNLEDSFNYTYLGSTYQGDKIENFNFFFKYIFNLKKDVAMNINLMKPKRFYVALLDFVYKILKFIN